MRQTLSLKSLPKSSERFNHGLLRQVHRAYNKRARPLSMRTKMCVNEVMLNAYVIIDENQQLATCYGCPVIARCRPLDTFRAFKPDQGTFLAFPEYDRRA